MKHPVTRLVVDFLDAHAGRGFKTKELARLLGLPKQGEEYQMLKAALRTLSGKGVIRRLPGQKWGKDAPKPAERLDTPDAAGSRQGGPFPPLPDGRRARTGRPGQPRDAGSARTRRAPINPADAPALAADLEVVGTFRRIGAHAVVKPAGKAPMPDVLIPRNASGGAEDGDRVVARITDTGAGLPHGEIVSVLGPEGHPAVELEALARRHGLSLDFPPDVTEEAAAISAHITDEELSRRLDLRETLCFTIDPADARDHDDAVSLEIDADGEYLLGVHIADVSHYVKPDSPLDREARSRGTSVYLVDGVVPMLPERLSNQLCSLQEHKDRLAYSALMTVSPRGVVKRVVFEKSVIRSARKFSYEEVQEILDRGRGEHAETLARMAALAGVLTAKRLREGSIDFDMPEVRVMLADDGTPAAIVPKPRLQSMRLIEEFMLLANRCVASEVKRLAGRARVLPFIYRVHDLPDPEKVAELVTFLQHLGISAVLDAASSRSFQSMLASLAGLPEAPVVQDVTIRSMAKAIYSEKNIGHFGLAFPAYTHFTSPIRRYPDLIVHRVLACYLHGAASPHTAADLAVIAKQSSERERTAVEAERESVRIKQVEYMQRHLGDVLEGVINGVTGWGFYVEILDILIEGLVHIRTLDQDYFIFDAARRELRGRRTGVRYQLGDRVRVQVARIDPVDRRIDFILVAEEGVHDRRRRRR